MRQKTLIIIAFIVATVVVATIANAAPRLTIKEGSFDFGFVPQNATVSHIFWLYSTGDVGDSLKIIKITPG